MKTSHAITPSSCGLFAGGLVGEEGDGFVVVLAGSQAVVEAADEAVEQVALGGGVSVTGGSANPTWGYAAFDAVLADAGIEVVKIPPRCPRANCFAEGPC